MHNALHIPELVLEILCWMSNGCKLNFSSTCSIMWNIGAPELWRNANIHAVCCLLSDVDISQQRHVTEKEWKPLMEYGRHIRSMQISDTPPAKFSFEKVYRDLCRYPYHYTEPLFPQLRSLSLDLEEAVSLSCCRHFIGRTQEIIRISVRKAVRSTSIMRAINAIQSSRNLSILSIRYRSEDSLLNEDTAALETATMALIRSLPCLVSLALPIEDPVRGSLFTCGETFPSLEQLKIRADPSKSRCLNPFAFTNLKVLSFGFTIYSVRMSALAGMEILRTIGSSSLAEFEFTCGQIELPVLLAMLQIVAGRWSSTLHKLVLSIPIEEDSGLLFEALSPTLQCKALRYVSIDGPRNMTLRDEDYDMISLAWPQLRGLWAPSDPRVPSIQWIHLATRRALLSFSRRCRALQYLCITVDLEQEGQPLEVDGPVSSAPLVELNLAHSTCRWNRADTHARFLKDIFPGMKAFRWYPTGDVGINQVGSCLKVTDRTLHPKPETMRIMADLPFLANTSPLFNIIT